MRQTIRFVRNGRVIEVGDARPGLLLLDYLRLVERATGTKAGCETGACGACTVVLGRLEGRHIAYDPVNACTTLLAQVDGREVVAIEDIAEDDGTLHPMQQALVEQHATQCGFCTPGMAMSLFALFHSEERAANEEPVRAAIQGNLCRCTGYRSIIAAGVQGSAHRRETRHDVSRPETAALLAGIADGDDVFVGAASEFVALPASLAVASALVADNPDALILAGGTVTENPFRRTAAKIILLSRVRELRRVVDAEAELTLGASVTLREAEHLLGAIDADLGRMIRRIGGSQLRSLATLGGNLLLGGQDSDLAAALLALGADVVFSSGDQTRRVAVESLYSSDGRAERDIAEILVEVMIPRPLPTTVFRAYRVSKRRDMSPLIVAGAFHIELDASGRIDAARFGFSGLAAAPGRARTAEAVLIGAHPLDRSMWPKAFAALRDDFSAEVNERAGARYRTETAQALLGKALIEAGGTSDQRTRLAGFRDEQYDA